MRFKHGIEWIIGLLAIFGLVGWTQINKKPVINSNNYREGLVQSGYLTIGIQGTYPPFSYFKNGKLEGFEPDLAKNVAKQIGLKPKFVPTKWDSLIAGLGSRQYDIILDDITPTKAREETYSFSTPYLYSRYVLISNQGVNGLSTLAEVKNKKLVEAIGRTEQQIAEKWNADVVPEGDLQTGLSLVRQERADGEITAQQAYIQYAKKIQ